MQTLYGLRRLISSTYTKLLRLRRTQYGLRLADTICASIMAKQFSKWTSISTYLIDRYLFVEAHKRNLAEQTRYNRLMVRHAKAKAKAAAKGAAKATVQALCRSGLVPLPPPPKVASGLLALPAPPAKAKAKARHP